MKTIWKFPLKTTDNQQVRMPKGAKVLCVQTQDETPCLWAEVDNSRALELRVFETFGTGHPMHADMGVSRVYIGTYQTNGGGLVFHVYESTGV